MMKKLWKNDAFDCHYFIDFGFTVECLIVEKRKEPLKPRLAILAMRR